MFYIYTYIHVHTYIQMYMYMYMYDMWSRGVHASCTFSYFSLSWKEQLPTSLILLVSSSLIPVRLVCWARLCWERGVWGSCEEGFSSGSLSSQQQRSFTRELRKREGGRKGRKVVYQFSETKQNRIYMYIELINEQKEGQEEIETCTTCIYDITNTVYFF